MLQFSMKEISSCSFTELLQSKSSWGLNDFAFRFTALNFFTSIMIGLWEAKSGVGRSIYEGC